MVAERAVFYAYWLSSCSWRVRVALHLKRVPYEEKSVDIVRERTHLTDQYRAINPAQKVPALVIGKVCGEAAGVPEGVTEEWLSQKWPAMSETMLYVCAKYQSDILKPLRTYRGVGARLVLRVVLLTSLPSSSHNRSQSQRPPVTMGHHGTSYNGPRKHHSTLTIKNIISSPLSLKFNGATIVESMAILQYLEDSRPEPTLTPKTPLLRARMTEICEIIVSGIQPLQNIGLRSHFDSKEKYQAFTKYWTERGLRTVEEQLQFTAGRYCVRDQLTLADLCLVPQVYNAVNKQGLDLNKFPILHKLYERLLEEEAFKKTHPDVVKYEKLIGI